MSSNLLCHPLSADSSCSLQQVEEVTEADIISTVEFDHTGSYLATGDKGGRVVLFERHESKKQTCEYKFYTEFQSHEPEFDYLKSLEIEEKINKIRWCRRQNQAHFLLSTNGMHVCTLHVLSCSLTRLLSLPSLTPPVANLAGLDSPRPPGMPRIRSRLCLRHPQYTTKNGCISCTSPYMHTQTKTKQSNYGKCLRSHSR